MSISFALSIHNFIHSVGADCGFAAIIGLALVVILFFAHARETSNLRDGLDDAHERIESLEQQIQQVRYQQANQQRAATAMPAGVAAGTMPPVAPRPGGAQTSALRTTAAATALAQRPLAAAGGVALAPAATRGLGAPSLGSATKLIPDPGLPQNGANGGGAAANSAVDGDTIVGAAAVNASPGGATAAAAPPPAASRAGQAPRRTVPVNGGRSLLDEEPPRRRVWLIALSSIVAIAVVVVVLIVALGGGSGSTTNHKTAAAKKSKLPSFDAGKYRVAVLNGTAVNGLAADVFGVLRKKGFKQGQITNAATQTETSSIVYYVKTGDQAAARQVAGALGIGDKSVKVATPSALQSCAITTAGTKTNCASNVIVSVGSDQANRAQSNTVTTG